MKWNFANYIIQFELKFLAKKTKITRMLEEYLIDSFWQSKNENRNKIRIEPCNRFFK